jgi:hypothetical protein
VLHVRWETVAMCASYRNTPAITRIAATACRPSGVNTTQRERLACVPPPPNRSGAFHCQPSNRPNHGARIAHRWTRDSCPTTSMHFSIRSTRAAPAPASGGFPGRHCRNSLTTSTRIILLPVDHVLFLGSADCFATAAVISRKEEPSCSVIVNTHV